MKLHTVKTLNMSFGMLKIKVLAMELAFDNACLEDTNEDKLPMIEKAIKEAMFAKRNCVLAHKELVEMSKTNTGGSRKRRTQRKRKHHKRTHRKHRK